MRHYESIHNPVLVGSRLSCSLPLIKAVPVCAYKSIGFCVYDYYIFIQIVTVSIYNN